MTETFSVDLRGLLQVLSHNLYSTPAVYLRELLQNGVDAITARRAVDPAAPAGSIRVETPAARGDDLLVVTDNGIGLSADDMRQLLATIGRSSKRDDFEFGRAEFLGQFGIGLLSAFLACDELEVLSRSSLTPDAPTVRWRARSDGSYEIDLADESLAEAGTVVKLRRRPNEHLTSDHFVSEALTRYGRMLPLGITCATASGPVAITGAAWPWEMTEDERASFARAEFGFTPLTTLDVDLPAAGVRATLFVRPTPTHPGEDRQRVYLKGMLLADDIRSILPEWCFFVRGVFDVTSLRPTAAREALYEDDVLDGVREALGERILTWISSLQDWDPTLLQRFFDVHHRQVVAMALHDDTMLALARDRFVFETTEGPLTIDEFRARHPLVRYVGSVDQFRALAPVATAQGFGLINAGHTDEVELLSRFAAHDGFRFEEATASGLALALQEVTSAELEAAEPLLQDVRRLLGARDIDVEMRSFEPSETASIYLTDPTVRAQRLYRSAAEIDDVFGGVLSALGPVAANARPAFILNHRNRLVRALLALSQRGGSHLGMAAEIATGLYAQALLAGRHPLSAADTALLAGSYMMMINRVIAAEHTESDHGGTTQ